MRNLIPGLLFAGFTLALSSPHVGQAAGVKSGSANPAPPVIQVPQTPPPPILNPGVTPGAPGPSSITPSPRNSAGLATTVIPGPATGSSVPTGHAQRTRHRASRNQSRAVNEMEREIDRGISICRGC